MDRRRVRSRSGLHRGLQSTTTTESPASSKEQLSGTSRVSIRGSQKLSNSEILRRQTRSVSNITEISTNTQHEEMSVTQKELQGNSRSELSRKRKKSNSDDDADENFSKNPKTPIKKMTPKTPIKKPFLKTPVKKSSPDISFKTSTPTNFAKRKKIATVESDEENSVDVETSKQRDHKLLSKRKKFVTPVSDSESDSEPIKRSPLKMKRIDPKQSKKSAEIDKSPNTKPSQSARASPVTRSSQFGKLSLSGRSISLRRPAATQKESNTSKLKKLASPAKAMEIEQSEEDEESTSPNKKTCSNKLQDFLTKSGITLIENDKYQLDVGPPTVEKRMIKLLTSGKFKKEDIVNLWKTHIDNKDNLKIALNDVTIANDQLANRAGSNVSLIRIFLQIPVIQAEISNDLLRKLNDAVLIADSIDDVPWAPLLLQQFRFLEIITDTESLTMRLEELLETCPLWFQRELIVFLPDIVIDVQHHAIAEMLSKLMETQVELTTVVFECITNLTLGKEYLEELRDNVLNMLKTNVDVERIPAMAKFVLNECPSVEVCQKTLTLLRSLELQPLSGENSDKFYTCQSFLVRELGMSILLSKTMAQAATTVVKSTEESANPMDLIILLLVYSDTQKKKNAETVFKQHVKTGYCRSSLLSSFYHDYQEVAKSLQPQALQLASNLLKSEDRVYVDFAIEWFRHQFVSQAKAVYKQREIIERIILLMGNNDQTAKGALGILQRLTETEDEKAHLQPHCNHLRRLLEKIDKFDLQEVATLSDLLYALCTSTNGSSEALKDDLFILMQKQLLNAKTLNKCKGVLGAAMAIKHLAGKPESCKVAEDLFDKVEAGTKNCPRSQALFYDQIGRIIANTKDIDGKFLKIRTDEFERKFIETYMTDLNDYSGELVAKFGLNDPESNPQNCVIIFGDGKSGAVVPAFFRLLRTCYMRLDNGDLNEINMLLGCPVLMPNDMEIPEPRTLDLMICCINWFRELISAFVNQTDPILQEQVLKRLEDLMMLQAEFSTMLTLCNIRYQPPPCYFHLFPAPAFAKVEKKLSKKGKRSSMDKMSLPEWEAWEIGSTLCSKNPTYFRQMDAKIVDLLDLKMDQYVTQSPKNISKAQVCFLIRELLGMFEGGEVSEILMRDLIHLLPKICAKLQDIVTELRDKDKEDMKNRQAVKLILSLLTSIFDWKGFMSAIYHSMLRDGLRTLAGQINKANSMLRSSKELVAESYRYFESLADIATEISLAFALVKMCRTLMKHSDTFVSQYKDKQAKMAYGFLSLQWPDDKTTTGTYKAAAVGLLSNWIHNEPDPLDVVTSTMEWLPDEVAALEKPQDRLQRLPTITKSNFHHMFQRLFEGLIKGTRISTSAATTDPERVQVWQRVGNNVQKIVQICKSSSRSVLLPFLRSMTSLVKLFITSGMPIMEANLRYQPDQVTGIMKMMQSGTRYLNVVCVDSVEKKDMTLAKLIPAAKQATERLLYLVKGMLVANNSSDAFWMGNLVNKNLEGQQIVSQSSNDVSGSASGLEDNDDEILSDDLPSGIEEEVSDDDT